MSRTTMTCTNQQKAAPVHNCVVVVEVIVRAVIVVVIGGFALFAAEREVRTMATSTTQPKTVRPNTLHFAPPIC
jgi:hypothetical protein